MEVLAVRDDYGFFFSSRRRHTRSLRDWSSDVCSSDLSPHDARVLNQTQIRLERYDPRKIQGGTGWPVRKCSHIEVQRLTQRNAYELLKGEIGRASCRERVERSVVWRALKKKQ